MRRFSLTVMAVATGVVVASLLAGRSGTTAKVVRFSNIEPKLDVDGNIVNAHDGTYRRFGDFYYYHGAEYGLCREPPKLGCDGGTTHGCGFHTNHNVSIWRSTDLSSGSWEKVGTAMECAKLDGCGVLYRPHVVFNPRTKEYVLFVNYVGLGGGYKGYAVYSAPSPEGPFALRNPQMNVTRLCPGPAAPGPSCGEAQGGCGDFDVFVDENDGQGYIVYGCNFYMSIERLTPDYIGNPTAGNASAPGGKFNGTVFPDYFVEAPALFKRETFTICFMAIAAAFAPKVAELSFIHPRHQWGLGNCSPVAILRAYLHRAIKDTSLGAYRRQDKGAYTEDRTT